MTTYAVEYTFDITRTAEKEQVRPAHRDFLSGLHENGRLLAFGPWLDNAAPGALLVLVGDSDDEVRALLDEDPYHRAKVVAHRTVRAWNPEIGPFRAEKD